MRGEAKYRESTSSSTQKEGRIARGYCGYCGFRKLALDSDSRCNFCLKVALRSYHAKRNAIKKNIEKQNQRLFEEDNAKKAQIGRVMKEIDLTSPSATAERLSAPSGLKMHFNLANSKD